MAEVTFEGCWTALPTPFTKGGARLDEGALGRLVERQIAAEVKGLVPCGTTGEAPTLSEAEWERVVGHTVETSAGRVPVMAGCGTNSTAHTLHLARRAEALGADALLVVNPYYNKPTQAGLYAHFKAVADGVSIPLCLYNIPGRSAGAIAPHTLARLAEIPNIQAVKEATGNMTVASEFMDRCGDRLTFLCGDDVTSLPFLALGGQGVVSVMSNVCPALTVRLVRAACAGDIATARALHYRLYPLMKALFLETNPGPLKAALALMGLMEEVPRLPLVAPEPGVHAALTEALAALDLLPARGAQA